MKADVESRRWPERMRRAVAFTNHYPLTTNHRLRVAAFEPRSLVNGPGVRAVLWVQGCGRRCPGCFNPEFLPREGGRLAAVEEVMSWIRDAASALATNHQPPTTLEGITFSGGEPFDQAAGLAVVAQAVRRLGLGVLIFTGYPWEDLEQGRDLGQRALLAAADLLVACPYQRDRPGTHPLLSSANQRLIFLTHRYRGYDFGRNRRLEIRIAPDGTLRTTGFPPPLTTHH